MRDTRVDGLRRGDPAELQERDDALDALSRLMSEAHAGSGRLVFVAGEAGIGKTSLIERFRDETTGEAIFLLGRCEPLSTPVPLGPLHDMAFALGTQFQSALAAGGAGVKLFGAFLAALDAIKNPIVAIEDVHWADEATLDLLRYVGRRLALRRVLLIVTFRADEPSTPRLVRTLVGDLTTLPLVRRIELQPLSEGAVAAMAGGSGVDAGNLYRQTGGNPFFVTEVLSARTAGVPPTVRDAVLARAARLSPAAQAVLRAAACLGPPLSADFLDEVSGQQGPAMDECLAAGMLVLADDGISFRHELARAAVLDEIGARETAALHARALELLLQHPAGTVELERLVRHSEGAGDRTGLLGFSREAGDRAARLGAHRESAALYAKALSVTDGAPNELRAELLDARAFQCFLTNQLDEAFAARRAALEIWTVLGNTRRQSECLRWIARAGWVAGSTEGAEEAALAAVQAVEHLGGHELAMAYATLAHFNMLGHHNDQALDWGQKALGLADELGDEEARCYALTNVAIARVMSGDESGWDLIDESLRIAYAVGFEDHVARTCFHAHQFAMYQRRYELAQRWFVEGFGYASERDLETWRQFMLAWRARGLFEQGHWDEAQECASTVIAMVPSEDARKLQALAVLARIRIRRGETGAEAILRQASELDARSPLTEWHIRIAAARAELVWWSGHRTPPEDLHDAYARALSLGEPWNTGELAYWMWRFDAIVEPPDGAAEPFALQIAGEWQAAYDRWMEMGCPYEAAITLSESGEEQALREALEVFDRLGAAPARAAAAHQLRELGVRNIPRRRGKGSGDPQALTGRELEILSPMLEGLRNAEIAQLLFLSERTVEHHVSSILHKLGTRTRLEAAKEARRLGLEPTP